MVEDTHAVVQRRLATVTVPSPLCDFVPPCEFPIQTARKEHENVPTISRRTITVSMSQLTQAHCN